MPRKTRSDLNPSLRDTALKLRLQGYPISHIARELGGVSRARVHALLKERPQLNVITMSITDAELERLRERGGRPWLRKLLAYALKPATAPPQPVRPTDTATGAKPPSASR